MSLAKPKILFFTSHCPHDASNGAHLRTLHIARFLQERGDLRLVLAGRWPFNPDAIKKAAAEFNLSAVMSFLRAPRRGFIERVRYELDPLVLNTHNAIVSSADTVKLVELLEDTDLSWFYGVHIPNALRLTTVRSSFLDVDDVPSQYYRSCAEAETNPIRRLLLLRQIVLWRKREDRLLTRFTLLGVSSAQDRERFNNDSRVHVIPNGFESVTDIPSQRRNAPCSVGFIGDCTYPPNKEGVAWFIRNVWTLIKAKIPAARLRLVGKATMDEEFQVGPDIDGLGFVDDPAAEISTWSVMIVPILTGGGTRVKIAEAFSRKCPVVSTSMGAYGYDVTTGRHLLLADDPRDFADACCRIIHDEDLAQVLIGNAHGLFERQYGLQAIKTKVHAAVDHCLASQHNERDAE